MVFQENYFCFHSSIWHYTESTEAVWSENLLIILIKCICKIFNKKTHPTIGNEGSTTICVTSQRSHVQSCHTVFSTATKDDKKYCEKAIEKCETKKWSTSKSGTPCCVDRRRLLGLHRWQTNVKGHHEMIIKIAVYQNGSPSLLSSSMTNNSCPFLLARCNGVFPFLSTIFTLAPLLTSSLIVEACPSVAQICSGVWPEESLGKEICGFATNYFDQTWLS